MTEPSQEPYDESSDAPDPQMQSIEEAEREEHDDEGLTTEELRPEEELTEWEAPREPSTPTAEGYTELDEEYGDTIDERLAQEEPEES